MNADGHLFRERIGRVRGVLRDEELAYFLVFDPRNIRYLTGFSGSVGVLLITSEEIFLISDFRYRAQAAEQAPLAHFVELEDHLERLVPSLLTSPGTVGVESGFLTLAQWSKLEPGLAGHGYKPVDGRIERLRMIKHESELVSIREAAVLAVRTFEHMRQMKIVGRTEREVALELEVWARKEGSEPVSFPYIVASGPRAAMPHAQVTSAIIERGQLLVVDLGAVVDGYASDMTRTFATGGVSNEERALHDLVRNAHAAACEALRAGVRCADVDQVARSMIEREGLGDHFKHGLGHGVGLDVHEAPRLSSKSEDVLEADMVLTIEPGVYLEGKTGVRVEDTVRVTTGAAEVMTEFERHLVMLE